MSKQVVIGYLKDNVVPGPVFPIYKMAERYYIKSRYAGNMRISNKIIDQLKKEGSFIDEPRYILLTEDLNAFAINRELVMTGSREYLIKRLTDMGSSMSKEMNEKVINWIFNTYTNRFLDNSKIN